MPRLQTAEPVPHPDSREARLRDRIRHNERGRLAGAARTLGYAVLGLVWTYAMFLVVTVFWPMVWTDDAVGAIFVGGFAILFLLEWGGALFNRWHSR